jgi:hypothetical protein
MGHNRLNTLPDTAPWRKVVKHLAEGADVGVVAAATTEAAAQGLEQALKDKGVAKTVFLLAKTVLAARLQDFGAELNAAGIGVQGAPSVIELTCAFSEAVDVHLRSTGQRTDIGEMARLAAVESLTSLLRDKAGNLFQIGPADVQAAAKSFSTPAGFRNLFHDYFSRFTERFIGYHLGRELSFHVGGNGRFASPEAHSEFLKDMGLHCRQAALIVKKYAEEWYSKNNFLNGIDETAATRFTAHCMKKLRAELLARGGRDA